MIVVSEVFPVLLPVITQITGKELNTEITTRIVAITNDGRSSGKVMAE